MVRYIVAFLLLVICELVYFRIAEKFHITDSPTVRSSHSQIEIVGGGIIFLLALWIWSSLFGFGYLWFLTAVTLVAMVSFTDDVKPLPDSVRLVVQFAAVLLMFCQLDILNIGTWWIRIIVLLVCVGAANVINFMDGVNGITGGYAMACLIPLFLLNRSLHFTEESLIFSVALADVVFCFFNFRPKGKAKCFAGDVGSIGVAYVLLFLIGCLIFKAKGDVSYLIFLMVYGVDGCLTIIHRIMLHENLGVAHRKHAYQIMANELGIGHLKVASFYSVLQLTISLGFIYLCPKTVSAHWWYFSGCAVALSLAYLFFMRKYYHLHGEYLDSLGCECEK